MISRTTPYILRQARSHFQVWISSRLFWIAIVSAFFVLTGVSSFFIYTAVTTVERDVSILHLAITQRAASRITSALSEVRRIAGHMVKEHGFIAPSEYEHHVALFMKDNPEFSHFSLISTDGKEVFRIDRLAIVRAEDLTNYRGNEGFETLKRGSIPFYVGPVSFSDQGEPEVVLSFPVKSLQGEFLGVLMGNLNLKFMWNLMGEITVGSRGKVYVVDDKGNLIADPDSSLVLRGENYLHRPAVLALVRGEARVDGLGPEGTYVNDAGVTMFGTGVRIPSLGWSVLTEEPVADAFIGSRRILAAGIVLLVLSAFLFFFFIILLRQLLQLTKSLEYERVHSEAIVSNLTDGIIEYGPSRRVLLVNPEAERLLGVDQSVLKGRSLADPSLARSPTYAGFLAVISDAETSPGAALAEKKVTTEIAIDKPRDLVLQVTTVPVIGFGGKAESYLKIMRDVTREKFLNKVKSEFINIAAHQLRTPLSGLKWTMRIMLDGDVGEMSAEQKRLLARGYEANERMIRLVNDLLDVARIEEGRFGYEFAKHDLGKIIQSSADDLALTAQERRITVTIHPSRATLAELTLDEKKMKLVLENIIENAIHYTLPGGRIDITVSPLGEKYVEIQIKDTGIGIPKNHLPRLFTKFARADNVVRLGIEGSGLGLFIARNVVHRHGGEIWVESEEHRGTTVHFTLPRQEALIPKVGPENPVGAL